MSSRDLHEYTPGQFTQVTRMIQPAAGVEAVYFMDPERVRLAGYGVELWDSETAGVQLIEGTDYVLEYKDEEVSGTEGFDVNAGYMVINPAYQGAALYLTAKIVGGYTFRPYRPRLVDVSVDTVLTMSVISDMLVRVDTTAGDINITLPDFSGDVLAINNQVTILPTGDNVVVVDHSSFVQDVRLSGTAATFICNGVGWLQLGGSGGGTGGGMAVGEVAWWPGAGVPDRSKLVCDGALYNPADYPSLFAKLGTLYGGDGVATFGVPDLSGITPGAFGTRTVNGRTKGDATAIGGVREDQDQIITGSIEAGGLFRGTMSGVGAFTQGTSASLNSNDGVNINTSQRTDFNSALVARTGTYSRSTELVGRWVIQAYDTVQEVPADPSLVRDWVQKFLQETTPPASVVNAWGSGIFYIAIGYSFNGNPGRATMTLFVNTADGYNRYALASMDFEAGDSWIGSMYDAATNSFKPTSFGPDYTGLCVIAVYKWEAVSLGTLNPAVDGWETVYGNTTGAASIPNTWGAGTYEFTVTNGASDSVYGMTVTEENISSGTDLVNSPASDSEVFVRYTASENTFSRVGTAGNITRIRKFTGLLNVIHTYNAGYVYKLVRVDTTAGNVTYTLPTGGQVVGDTYKVRNVGSNTAAKVICEGIRIGHGYMVTFVWDGYGWEYDDCIIDEYETSDANYGHKVTKWARGRMQITSFSNSGQANPTYPEPFVGYIPHVVVCPYYTTTSGGRMSFVTSVSLGGHTHKTTSESGSGANCAVESIASGRWK